LYIFDRNNKFRVYCYRFATHINFERFILFLITLSSVKLVIDTYTDSFEEPHKVIRISQTLDTCFTVIFAIEALIKAIAFGFI